MHAVVVDSLEEYLSGTLEPADERIIGQHLSTCQLCRDEIRAMQDVSELFVSFQSNEVVEPSPLFYASVMRQASQRETPSFASFFSMDLAFGRRLVFACLLIVAVMGGFLVSRESGYSSGPSVPSPEAVMAQDSETEFDSAPAHHNMLVTLTAAAYEQR